jgi:hypothetical protein
MDKYTHSTMNVKNSWSLLDSPSTNIFCIQTIILHFTIPSHK